MPPELLSVDNSSYVSTTIYHIRIPSYEYFSYHRATVLTNGKLEVQHFSQNSKETIFVFQSASNPHSDIIVYIHQAVNFYYYKYTVDGMNVIAVSILFYHKDITV